jgi:hypothetical protein
MPSGKPQTLTLLAAMVAVFLSGCVTQPDINRLSPPDREHKSFLALSPKDRVIDGVFVTWEIRDDVLEYCKRVSGARSPTIGCAVWDVKTKRCTIVTPPLTTHTVLGHELRHCFEGSFHF